MECRLPALTSEDATLNATPRPQAIPAVQIDNARVKVTEWRFAPGAETGWHRHAHDYVVVPMRDGRLLLETAAGKVTADLKAGQSYTRNEGVEHNVVNANDFEYAFVEIELKEPPPAPAGT